MASGYGVAMHPIDRMAKYPRYGTGPCLDRMHRLIETLGAPTDRAIKITGSNGKGSTSHMAAAVLQHHDLRTGLFTSPHFFRFNERIQVDGCSISDSDFHGCLDRVERAARTIAPNAFGGFELLTAVATVWFNEQSVDAIVWEAGIGGQWDATRVLPCCVSTVVHVALEHTGLLGATLEEIALDKSRVADDSVPLVLGQLTEKVRAAVGRDRVSRGASPAIHAEPLPPNVVLAMPGAHQQENARCAVETTSRLLGDAFSFTQCSQALAHAPCPGRFETWTDGEITVHVDAAHNETGIVCALETLRSIHGPTVQPIVVVGISRDRDYAGMLPVLTASARHTVCTAARHKGIPGEALAVFAHGPTHCADSVSDALAVARQLTRELRAPILVTGGLFLAAEALWSLQGNDPRDLRF